MNRHSQKLAHLPSGYLNQRQMNGLGATSFFDTIADALNQATKDQGATFVSNVISSTEFKKILTKVEEAGEVGVKKAASENAMYLLGAAVAGGAIGSLALKTGTVGTIGVGLLGVWAVANILGGQDGSTKARRV